MTYELSRSGHNDVGSFGEGDFLLPPFTAIASPVDRNRGDVQRVSQPLNLLVDLNGKLPGGDQYQRIGVGSGFPCLKIQDG